MTMLRCQFEPDRQQSLFGFKPQPTFHAVATSAEKPDIDVFGSDFNAIRKFYDSLDKDQSHFKNSNDICTPLDCVKEMVDTIPSELWARKNLKIFDSCCGNGNFHAYILKKTDINNLFFNEINERRVENVKRIFGDDINVTELDFLSFEDRESYDLVVSNPPYAKFTDDKRTAKNHNMSRDFILKALNITKPNGYILFIVPNNWMSYADRNRLPDILSRHQFIHLNINGAKKWFPKVGSSFTWFILKKTENKHPFTVDNNYTIKDRQEVKLDKGARFIPLYYSDIVRSIIAKTTNAGNAKYKIETSSILHKYTKKDLLSTQENDVYRHKVIHTPSQTVWSKVPHKYQNGWKIFISLTNQYQTFIDNCGMTQSIAFIRCESKAQAERIQRELNSPIYHFLNNITRYGNFNNIRVLQNFPALQDFDFSDKEKDFIKKFNTKYYE